MTTSIGTKIFAEQHNGIFYVRDNIKNRSTTVSIDVDGLGYMRWFDLKNVEEDKDIVATLVRQAFAAGIVSGREQMRIEVENGMKAFLGIFVSSSD
jgi:hypothetical protein